MTVRDCILLLAIDIGPEGEDSKCTKFGGGGDTTGETAVSDDTKPAETAEVCIC